MEEYKPTREDEALFEAVRQHDRSAYADVVRGYEADRDAMLRQAESGPRIKSYFPRAEENPAKKEGLIIKFPLNDEN